MRYSTSILTQGSKHARVALQDAADHRSGASSLARSPPTAVMTTTTRSRAQTVQSASATTRCRVGLALTTTHARCCVTIRQAVSRHCTGRERGEGCFSQGAATRPDVRLRLQRTSVLMPMPYSSRACASPSASPSCARTPPAVAAARTHKSQVSIRYVRRKPHSIDTVVLSTLASPPRSRHAVLTEAVYRGDHQCPVCPKAS